MASYALIEAGKVINTIVWDGPDAEPMDFGEGVTYEEMPDSAGNNPSIGWSFSGGVFTAPPPTDEEIEAERQLKISNNIGTKDSLMNEATQQIGVLQDAVDLDMATTEEAAALPLWKKYRVLLSRIDANTDADISWPDKPVA